MLESTLAALQVMFTLSGAFFLFAGVVVGLIFGVVPGIGGTTAITPANRKNAPESVNITCRAANVLSSMDASASGGGPS